MLRDTKKVTQHLSHGSFGGVVSVVPQFDAFGRYDDLPINVMVTKIWNLGDDVPLIDKSP